LRYNKMLPLCSERPTTYYSSDPRTSTMTYNSENNYSRLYHTLSNSDSAYYSLLSNTVPVYPINNSHGGSLNREAKKHKRKSQHHHKKRDSNENEKFDTLMLPQYLSYQNSNYCHPQSHFSKQNERQNNLTKFENFSMPTAAAAAVASSPQQQHQLYSTILPKNKRDPTQPSTSSDFEEEALLPPPSTPNKSTTNNGITLPPNLLRIVNSTSKFTSHKLRLCLKLNEADFTNPKISFEYAPTEFDPTNEPQFVFSVGTHKIFSFDTYDTVFPSKTSQPEICVNCLPELLQTLFAGFDASLMYFGAISRPIFRNKTNDKII
jgi:hypothetical protein